MDFQMGSGRRATSAVFFPSRVIAARAFPSKLRFPCGNATQSIVTMAVIHKDKWWIRSSGSQVNRNRLPSFDRLPTQKSFQKHETPPKRDESNCNNCRFSILYASFRHMTTSRHRFDCIDCKVITHKQDDGKHREEKQGRNVFWSGDRRRDSSAPPSTTSLSRAIIYWSTLDEPCQPDLTNTAACKWALSGLKDDAYWQSRWPAFIIRHFLLPGEYVGLLFKRWATVDETGKSSGVTNRLHVRKSSLRIWTPLQICTYKICTYNGNGCCYCHCHHSSLHFFSQRERETTANSLIGYDIEQAAYYIVFHFCI